MNDYSQDQIHSLSSDNSSFFLLGQGSMPSDFSLMSNGANRPEIVNGGRNSFPSAGIDVVNSTLARTSLSQHSLGSDTNLQDLQAKMDQLLKENYQLKETLNQNNLAMKTQFETLVMWQEEVFKTHQTHKQKFSETRDLVLKLRTENANLKKQIEERLEGVTSKSNSITASGDLEQENVLLKRRVDDLQEKLLLQSQHDGFSSKKEKEMHSLVDNLFQKLETAERNCRQFSITNENLVIQKSRTEEKYKKLEQELSIVKKELEESLTAKESLSVRTEQTKKTSEEAPTSILPNSDARAQISNLFKQLEDERMKVSKLKEELEAEKSLRPAEPKLNVSGQLNEYIEKLDDMNLSFDKQSERFKSMNSWLNLAEEKIDENILPDASAETEAKMRIEIATLKEHLTLEQTSCQEKRDCLQKMQVQFEKLLKDYEDLQNEWKKFEEEKPIKKYEEEIQSLTSQLKAKNELLSRRDKEVETMKQHLQQMQLQCEEVGILRAQVKVYQSDFNAERDAREKLVGEKEEIAKKLRIAERQVEDLKTQLTAVQNSTSRSKEPSPSPSLITEPPSRPEEDEDIPHKPFSCFQCNQGFREIRQLEEHVEECLNLRN